jgi:hypothetical protein
MLNYQSVIGREQGKEKKIRHNIQKYGLFLLHSQLYEISLFRFCILCTQKPNFFMECKKISFEILLIDNELYLNLVQLNINFAAFCRYFAPLHCDFLLSVVA